MYFEPVCFDPFVWNTHACFWLGRSTANSFPSSDPIYSMLPASAGDENIGHLFELNSVPPAPVFASSAYSKPESEVEKYTLPSRTAGEPITHDPLLLKAHFF